MTVGRWTLWPGATTKDHIAQCLIGSSRFTWCWRTRVSSMATWRRLQAWWPQANTTRVAGNRTCHRKNFKFPDWSSSSNLLWDTQQVPGFLLENCRKLWYISRFFLSRFSTSNQPKLSTNLRLIGTILLSLELVTRSAWHGHWLVNGHPGSSFLCPKAPGPDMGMRVPSFRIINAVHLALWHGHERPLNKVPFHHCWWCRSRTGPQSSGRSYVPGHGSCGRPAETCYYSCLWRSQGRYGKISCLDCTWRVDSYGGCNARHRG